MICTSCGTENRAGRRFCLNCGTALGLACPNCGSENEPEARFCGSCGHTLAGAPAGGGAGGTTAAARPPATISTAPAAAPVSPAPAAERRLVTVLFADLVGFTSFAEERDAEEVRNTLERYSSLAREIVARYGGTIEKFIGDAVMAVWGTPVAHEDDAERAVRAALELVDSVSTLGPEIMARAGVLTGEAAVNLAATDQGLLAGDLVNTAARLQSVAPPATVLVGESTMRAASAAVAFEAAGEQALKGKQTPVPAWRALRVVAQRGGAGRSESLETPFVGREEEFRLLRDQLHLAGRDPRVRLISITGPGGIGKSRLAWELEKYVDGVVELIAWHRGRCPAYGEGVSFWALGEMVRGRARLAESDDEPTTRARIRATVEEYVVDEAEREWIEQALLTLLGVEHDGQAARETLFAAWRRFFENIAARATTVLVFEDLHWADDGLLDFIDHLLDWSKSVPMLIVTLARPELFDRRPNWGAGRRTFTALALDPLAEEHMREMLSALVPDLPERALATVVERADGIPLYAVETVRMLIADGRLAEHAGAWQPTGELGDLQVPDSLRSLITSRLDALEPADRSLLQDASVLGQSFTLPALAAVAGADAQADGLEQQLRGLVRRELLTMDVDPRSPERGQYAFMQSLVQEVAYSTLARPERRARHLAAARHFEATAGEEIAGVLAGHYVAAYEASAAGPEAEAVATQARLALRAAAERAASLGGHVQAADFLEQALGVTSDSAERGRILERQAEELIAGGRYERADGPARAAVEVFEQAADAYGTSRARALVAEVLIANSQPADALPLLRQALAELPADAPPEVRVKALARLARALYRNLEADESLRVADEGMALAEKLNLRRLVAELMVTKGTAHTMLGHDYQGIALLKEGIELARRESDTETALRGSSNIAGSIAMYSSSEEAMRIGREALALSRQTGDRLYEVWHFRNLMTGAFFTGEPLAPLLAEADEMLSLELDPSDRRRLLRTYVLLCHVTGRELSEDAAALSLDPASTDDPQEKSDLSWLLGLRAAAAGDHASASQLYEQNEHYRTGLGSLAVGALHAALAGDAGRVEALLAAAADTTVRGSWEEGVRMGARAGLEALRGRPMEALPSFRESIRRLKGLQMGYSSALVQLLMLRTLGADNAEARAAGEEALATYEHMGARPFAEQVRALLGATPGAAVPAPASPAPATQTQPAAETTV